MQQVGDRLQRCCGAFRTAFYFYLEQLGMRWMLPGR